MIIVNQKAFSKLIDQYLAINSEVVEEAVRYIQASEEEKDWIKAAKISEILWITPNIRIVQILFQEIRYFAFVGVNLETVSLDETIVKEIELNAGILTLLISEGLLRIDKKSNNLKFYDSILFQHRDEGYKGHSKQDLIEYLEVVHIFCMPENSIYSDDLTHRIACYVFSKNPSQLILDFNNSLTELISELSIAGSDSISYKILLSCLFANAYKHAFLELYRLVERLFPISYLKEFHSIADSKLSFLDFISQLECITKWRPSEDEAIKKIFTNSSPTTQSYFQTFQASSPTFQSFQDYTFFYNLRNSIVHFRSNHLEIELSNQQWNLLLIATVFLIDEQYSINNKILK